MSQKIKARRSTRKARKGPDRRKGKSNPGRKNVGGQPAASSAVAGSTLFALRLKPKSGIEIFLNTDEGKRLLPNRYRVTDPENFEQMYYDLLKAYSRAQEILDGKPYTVDLYRSGLSLGMSLDHLLKKFETGIVPRGYRYNVDRLEESGEYYFTIYTECDFPNHWHAFALKPSLLYLEKRNPKLLKLYMAFWKAFSYHTDIGFWWGDEMGFAECWLEERISEMQQEYDVDFDIPKFERTEEQQDYYDAVACQNDYNSGNARRFQNLIQATPLQSPAQLLARLKKLNSRSPLAKVIRAGCELLKEPYCLQHFVYETIDDEYDNVGLKLEQQANIIWDAEDHYTRLQEEVIDANAHEGIYPPFMNWTVNRRTEKIDFDWMKNGEKWPTRLSEFHSFATAIIDSYIPKQKEKKDE